MEEESLEQNSDVLRQKLRVLDVAAAELQSLKPDRADYTQKGAIFFGTDRSSAETSVQEQIKELQSLAAHPDQIIMRGFMALEEGSVHGRDAAEAMQQPPPGQAAAGASRFGANLSDSS